MKLELTNGDEIELSINFRKLAMLREKNKTAYAEYNRVIMNGTKDLFDYVAVIYAGYCCNCDEAMGYKQFLEFVPTNMNTVIEAFNSIVAPKKKQDSPVNSDEEQVK